MLTSGGERVLYYCDVVDNEEEREILLGTAWFTIALFGLAGLLGFYNLWWVLYKQKQYKSFYMCLIYIFGQGICMARVASCVLLYRLIKVMHENALCSVKVGNFSDKKKYITDAALLGNSFFECIGLSMLFKLNFGMVAVAMLASFTSKLKVIAEQKGPEPIRFYKISLRVGLFLYIAITMSFTTWRIILNKKHYSDTISIWS